MKKEKKFSQVQILLSAENSAKLGLANQTYIVSFPMHRRRLRAHPRPRFRRRPTIESLESRLPLTPAGFQTELILDNLNQPVEVAVLPGADEILTLQKDGTIYITDPLANNPRKDVYLQVPNVDTVGEKGLLNLAFDPNFSSNNFFYVFYHNRAADRARVSRFVHRGSNARPTDEVLIWEDHINLSAQTTPEHLGGLLSFGPDGFLYLGIGDKRDNPADSQDLTKSAGKILRVNPGGVSSGGPWVRGRTNVHLIPRSNPFVDGRGGSLDEIWALGLRNPFRGGWEPATGTLLISDVGGNIQSGADASWEDLHEVDLADGGSNFGWPNCEGPTCTGQQPANYSEPKFSIQHPDARAVVVGPVNTTNLFPTQYDNALFLADYGARWLRYLKLDSNGNVTPNTPAGGFNFTNMNGRPVSLKFGPGGLYYVEIVKARTSPVGTVRRISFASGNQPPSITRATANQTSGAAPLTVEFRLRVTDPENDRLTIDWDFGDGNGRTRTGVRSGSTIRQFHTFRSSGTYFVNATVSDGIGSTSADPIQIQIGVPPIPIIELPANGSSFRAGDVVRIRGRATDEGRSLPISSHSWTVDFLHDDHTHPTLTAVAGTRCSTNNRSCLDLRIPTSGHDFSGETGYEIRLDVTDSEGLSASRSVVLEPEKSNLTFTSNVPGNVNFTIDQVPRRGPFTIDTLIGFEHTISVPAEVIANGNRFVFTGWSTGGARQQRIVVPANNRTYRANYQIAQAADGNVSTGSLNASTSWRTVTLPEQFQSMVVVASTVDDGGPPVVTRIRNASGNSFQIKLDRADGNGGTVTAEVQYIVAEAGSYSVSGDGIKMEAFTVDSTVTDYRGRWVGQDVFSELNTSFTRPVVLGQVMSYNDPDWSTFWSRSNQSKNNPPSARQLRVGKHVGEDADRTRANETLGVIVIESGSGTLNGQRFEAGVGADSVTSSGSSYRLGLNPTLAIVTQTAMDGSEGSWAVLDGPNEFSGANLALAVREDQVRDNEQSHGTEQVAYLAFADGTTTTNGTPRITSNGGDNTARVSVAEGETFVTDVEATDAEDSEGNGLSYQISGGVDRGDFQINASTGVLTFRNPPNTNNPVDSNRNNEYIVAVRATDSSGRFGTQTLTVEVTTSMTPGQGDGNVEVGTTSASTGGFTTVRLNRSFQNMVVVASAVDRPGVPLVTRIRNANGDSFQLKLDRADQATGNVSTEVQYFVAEAGSYSDASDGIKMQAFTVDSTTTDRLGRWVGMDVFSELDVRFTNPVVLGQVMSYNDPDWSVFWSRGRNSKNQPPVANQLLVGKHVGEDPDRLRATETLGVIVIEAGSGTINGTRYAAALGSDTIRSTGGSYRTGLTNPAVAVVSQAAMDGSEGSWAVLEGPSPFSGSNLQVKLLEDTLGDREQSHGTEQVAWVAFAGNVSSAAALAVPDTSARKPSISIQRARYLAYQARLERVLESEDDDNDPWS